MKEFGGWGEDKAVSFLRKKGFRILARNFRSRFGELDIVAKKGRMLVFFEVKTRSNSGKIRPFEAVDQKKQEKIKILASEFLQKTKVEYRSVRFDVISVVGNETSCLIEHIENAFD